jgi:hypothetical protein
MRRGRGSECDRSINQCTTNLARAIGTDRGRGSSVTLATVATVSIGALLAQPHAEGTRRSLAGAACLLAPGAEQGGQSGEVEQQGFRQPTCNSGKPVVRAWARAPQT